MRVAALGELTRVAGGTYSCGSQRFLLEVCPFACTLCVFATGSIKTSKATYDNQYDNLVAFFLSKKDVSMLAYNS